MLRKPACESFIGRVFFAAPSNGVLYRIVRPREQARYSAALALLNAMSNADRADIGIKPADFPRIAREMALR